MSHFIDFNFASADVATDVPDWLSENQVTGVEWQEIGRGPNGWPDIRFSGQPDDLRKLIDVFVDCDDDRDYFTRKMLNSA